MLSMMVLVDGILPIDFPFSAVFMCSIACMKLEEYQTAKSALETGSALAPGESRFTKLIKECIDCIAGL